MNTVSDSKVTDSVKYSVQSKIVEAFPDAAELQKQMSEKISTLTTPADIQRFLHSLEPYLAEFAQVTEKQIKKLLEKFIREVLGC